MLITVTAGTAAPGVGISGLPPSLAVGDTIIVTAFGGTAPYSWSSSYPAVSVTQLNATDARVVALQPSPNVNITATDQFSIFCTQLVNAYAFTSKLGNITFIDGDTAVVPIYYSNFHSPLSLLSADISFPYDTTLFKFVGYDKNGTLTSAMSIAANQIFDTVKIGVAATVPIGIMTEQVFLKLKFVSKNTVSTPESSPLFYTMFLVNENVAGSLRPGMLTVNPIPNFAPVFSSVPNDTTINEGDIYTRTVSASDANGQTVHYFLTINPASSIASIDSVTGQFLFAPSMFSAGSYLFEVTANDGNGQTTQHQFTITVNNVNQLPYFTSAFPDSFITAEGNPFVFYVNGQDPDLTPVYFTVNAAPSGMTIDSATGKIEWTPSFTQSGFYTVDVYVHDLSGASVLHQQKFFVFNVNRPPAFITGVPDTTFIQEGKSFTLDLDASDPDSDPLYYTINFTPVGMTFDSATGIVTWTPAFWQSGEYAINYHVYDPSGANDFRQTIFEVIDSNRTPVFTVVPNDTLINEGVTYNAFIHADDPDLNAVKYYVQSGLPGGMLLDSVTGAITWTPDNTQQGVYTITILATDQQFHGSITHAFTVTVNNVNLTPVINTPLPDTLYVLEGQNFNVGLNATDADGGQIRYFVFNAPSGMTIDSLTGVIDWTPTYSQAGSYTPVFKAKDSLGAYDSKSPVFIVLNMNRPPVFTAVMNDTVINEDQLLQFTYAGADPDLDSLQFMLMKPIPGMSISSHGALQWTPNFAQAGVETVIVMMTDLQSVIMDTAVVTVLNVNNPPNFIAAPKDTAIARFDTLRFNYTAFDPEGQPVSFSLISAPPGVTLSPVGNFEWIPPVNANGMFMFVVEVTDGSLTVNDTLFVRVNRLGDVSGNGTITSFDAGMILRDQVGAITLTPLQARVGDVSGDASITSSDASFILQYVVGIINTFPGGLGKRAQSEAVMSAFAFRIVPSQQESEYDLIVSVNKPSNVYGITMSLGFDSTVVTAKTMSTMALTDSMMFSSFFPKERANLALAGTKPLNTAGDIARFTFALNKKNVRGNSVLFTMKKFVLNEKDYANDIAGITLSVKPAASLPTVYALEQNFPNPFNPSTTINYQLPNESRVSITVFNMLGQQVKQMVDADQAAGYHSIVWNGMDNNGSPVSSGVYLYKIVAQANGKSVFTATKKMMFLK
ncbi:MAG: putative Ig domain-containing protein [Bacteroidota bacterium]